MVNVVALVIVAPPLNVILWAAAVVVKVVADTLPLKEIGPVVLFSVNTFIPVKELKLALPDPELIVRLFPPPVTAASVRAPDPPPLLIITFPPRVSGAAKDKLVPDVVTFAEIDTVPPTVD